MRTSSRRGVGSALVARSLVTALVFCSGGLVTISNADAGEQAPVHVFVVRHAEAQRDAGRDPDLSSKGKGRAADLARLLGSAGVTHVFSSEYQRTQQTLAALAKEQGLELQVVSARDPETQIKTLKSLDPGSVAETTA